MVAERELDVHGRDSAVLASVWRGTAWEATVRGHVAVVDGTGATIRSLGDPDVVTTMRSAIKPIQALPFAEVFQALGYADDALAVGCASHEAAPDQVAVVAALLARLGLDESSLSCGPQLPSDQITRARRLVAGDSPRRIDNNCSGKHSAMLAACVGHGWPIVGYAEREHPLQQRINADLTRLSGCAAATAPWGIDGCGLPTYGLPLSGLARAFAAGTRDPLFRRCQEAMATYPHLVAGRGRLDTVLMTLMPERITSKGGAYAVWAGTVRPDGPGVAIKLEAGWAEHMPLIVCAVLTKLGVLDEPLPPELEPLAGGLVHNRAGAVDGQIRSELRDNDLAALAPL